VTQRWPHVAVLFMSGYSAGVFERAGRFNPEVQLLTKPFRKDELARMVRKAIDSARQ
jgi:hypothetical protein